MFGNVEELRAPEEVDRRRERVQSPVAVLSHTPL